MIKAMIQANELRIGNWVHSTQTDTDIVVSYHHIRFATINTDVGYMPIPLTPEVLERCGFEAVNADYQKGNIKIYSGHHEFYFWYRHIGDTIFPREVKLEYLHKLQNLYYALTGEELEVTL